MTHYVFDGILINVLWNGYTVMLSNDEGDSSFRKSTLEDQQRFVLGMSGKNTLDSSPYRLIQNIVCKEQISDCLFVHV
jgi:hypothetical protein